MVLHISFHFWFPTGLKNLVSWAKVQCLTHRCTSTSTPTGILSLSLQCLVDHLLLVANTVTDGVYMEVFESPVCHIQTLKGTLCVKGREKASVFRPENETRLGIKIQELYPQNYQSF